MSRQRGITLPGPWAAFSQHAMLAWARTPGPPLAVRLLFAAMGRTDRTNHANFAPGELAEILIGVKRRTGELSEARADSLTKALVKAKEMGYVDSISTRRCLVLPGHIYDKASGSGAPCRIHGPTL